ncbi:hypothetical protein TRVA0_004S01420 [Trichomonascus vanleenenianus]|uniref:uncharacterized protein n=1 Tax=Trichomonascus vanleenenianus TaxID=2268995 RepID=UPI003EC9E8A4
MVNRRYCELMKSYREVWRSAIYNTIGSDAAVHASRRLQNVGLEMALKERNWTMGCCIIHNLSKISHYVSTGIASRGNWVILYTEDGLISHMDLPNLRMRPVGLYMKGIRTVQCRSDGAMIAASLNGDILLYSSTGFLGHIRTNSPCINAALTSSFIYGLCDDGNIVQFDRATRNQIASYYIAGVRVYYDITAFGNDAVVSTSDMLLLVKGSEQKVIAIPKAPGRLPSKARLLNVYHRTMLIAYRRGGFSVFAATLLRKLKL